MCSVGWEEHTITLKSSDGTEQTVEVLYKDALAAIQHWLLHHPYDLESDTQFAPEMAATASEQVFKDYCSLRVFAARPIHALVRGCV
jgi:hypothetical protein